jgi:hypothetical protein
VYLPEKVAKYWKRRLEGIATEQDCFKLEVIFRSDINTAGSDDKDDKYLPTIVLIFFKSHCYKNTTE